MSNSEFDEWFWADSEDYVKYYLESCSDVLESEEETREVMNTNSLVEIAKCLHVIMQELRIRNDREG